MKNVDISTEAFKRNVRRSLSGADLHFALAVDEWPRPNDNIIINPLHSLTFRFPSSVRGEARCVTGEEQSAFVNLGAVVLIPANVPLHVRGDGGEMRIGRLEFPVGRFPVLDNCLNALKPKMASHWLNLGSPFVIQNLSRLVEEAKSPRQQSHELLQSLSTTIVVDIARSFDEKSRQPAPKLILAEKKIALVKDYILSFPGNRIAVEDLADVCNLSRRHFARIFKVSTGETVRDYVERHRIEKAKELLGARKLEIKQIAFLMGYADAAGFSSAFRRSTGQTPGSYRASANGAARGG